MPKADSFTNLVAASFHVVRSYRVMVAAERNLAKGRPSLGALWSLPSSWAQSVISLEALLNPDRQAFTAPARTSLTRFIPPDCPPDLFRALQALVEQHDTILQACGWADLIRVTNDPGYWVVRWHERLREGPAGQLADGMLATLEYWAGRVQQAVEALRATPDTDQGAPHSANASVSSAKEPVANSPATDGDNTTSGDPPATLVVTFTAGDRSYGFRKDSGPTALIPDGFKELIVLFVLKVMDGTPWEPIPWRAINAAVSGDRDAVRDRDSSTSISRKAFERLNKAVVELIGPSPGSNGRWFVTQPGVGVGLSSAVRWEVDRKLRIELSSKSAFDHATDPTVLAQSYAETARGSKTARMRRSSNRPRSEQDD
jgi:hypothetical protein